MRKSKTTIITIVTAIAILFSSAPNYAYYRAEEKSDDSFSTMGLSQEEIAKKRAELILEQDNSNSRPIYYSKTQLISELLNEGILQQDAEKAVESLHYDWEKQANERAYSMLRYRNMEKEAIINQLEYQGWDKDIAKNAVEQALVRQSKRKQEAKLEIEQILEENNIFSRQELVNLLTKEYKYSELEANYGINNNIIDFNHVAFKRAELELAKKPYSKKSLEYFLSSWPMFEKSEAKYAVERLKEEDNLIWNKQANREIIIMIENNYYKLDEIEILNMLKRQEYEEDLDSVKEMIEKSVEKIVTKAQKDRMESKVYMANTAIYLLNDSKKIYELQNILNNILTYDDMIRSIEMSSNENFIDKIRIEINLVDDDGD